MFIRTATCSALLLALIGAPLAAEAAAAHAPGGDGIGQQHRPGDRDHDGTISDEEIAAITERLKERPKLFAAVDQNDDGALSRGELMSARARLQHRRSGDGEHHLGDGHGHGARLHERADTDGDGTLSDAEKEVARLRLAQRRDGGDGERREEFKDRIDANGDGTIDEAERAAAKAAVEARLAEKAAKLQAEHPELFARIDQDGNGELSLQELRHAKVMHQRRQGGDTGVRDHGAGDGRAGRGQGGERRAGQVD